MHLGAWCVEEVSQSAKLGSQGMPSSFYFHIARQNDQATFLSRSDKVRMFCPGLCLVLGYDVVVLVERTRCAEDVSCVSGNPPFSSVALGREQGFAGTQDLPRVLSARRGEALSSPCARAFTPWPGAVVTLHPHHDPRGS